MFNGKIQYKTMGDVGNLQARIQSGRVSVFGLIHAGRILAEERPAREPLGAASISWRGRNEAHHQLVPWGETYEKMWKTRGVSHSENITDSYG